MSVNENTQDKVDVPTPIDNRPEWTVMVYFAADNDLEDEALENIKMMKKVGSTDEVQIVAQLDSRKVGSTLRLHIRNEGTMLEEDIKDELAEVNTGDPDELVDFVKWAMKNFEAKRYMLVLWGHGRGWETLENFDRVAAPTTDRVIKIQPKSKAFEQLSFGLTRNHRLRPFGKNKGERFIVSTTELDQILDRQEMGFLQDEMTGRGNVNSQDVLRMKELSDALDRALNGRKLDILGMDACMMGMAEVAHQIKDYARYLVASEHGIPDESWPYDLILARLTENSGMMSPKELSIRIVREYLIRFREQEREVTLSVCDLKKSEALVKAIKALVAVLIKEQPQGNNDSGGSQKTAEIVSPEVHNAVLAARVKAQSFYITDFVDLYDFCSYLQKYCRDPKITDQCEILKKTIRSETDNGPKDFVVGSGYFGHSLRGSNGVSIYFPAAGLSKKYANLDFAKDSRWGEFLVALTQPIDKFVEQKKAERDKMREPETAAGDSGNTLVPALSGGIKTPQGTPLKTPQGTPLKIPTLPNTRIPDEVLSQGPEKNPAKQSDYGSNYPKTSAD